MIAPIFVQTKVKKISLAISYTHDSQPLDYNKIIMNLNCTGFLWYFLTLQSKVVTMCTNCYRAKCEVYTVMSSKNAVFWGVTSWTLQVRYQIWGKMLPSSSSWKMNIKMFSKIFVTIYEATWPHIPEGANLCLQFAHIIYLLIFCNSWNKC